MNFIVPLTKVDTGNRMIETTKNEQNSSFAQIFQTAVEQANQADRVSQEGLLQIATGDADDLAQLTIASTEAELSLKLFVQLRNKAHDAYSEIMRMNL